MLFNPRPTYSVSLRTHFNGRKIDYRTSYRWFDINEVLPAESFHLFSIMNSGDVLDKLTKRGIPFEDAKRLVEDINATKT